MKKIVKTKKIVKKAVLKKSVRTVSKKVSPKPRAKTKAEIKKPAAKKRVSSVLKKFIENPIIAPRPENSWEAWQTFNPAAILLDNKVHFIYRAIGVDGLSRFGYAASADGFEINERSSDCVYEHHLAGSPKFSYFGSGGSFGGCEDPRLTRVGDEDRIFMTYTACDGGLRVGLTSIKIKDFLKKNWRWKKSLLISAPYQVHKNWVIFPEKINGQYAILHSLNPELTIAYLDDLDFEDGSHVESFYGGSKREKSWDTYVRGVAAPPLKTEDGWLVFYHAIDEKDSGKYKVGALLLDLKNPRKILFRSEKPILEPEEFYENNGYKGGVVYLSGAVIKDKQLILYYGGADSYVCAASADLGEFLAELKKGGRPKIGKKIIHSKK